MGNICSESVFEIKNEEMPLGITNFRTPHSSGQGYSMESIPDNQPDNRKEVVRGDRDKLFRAIVKLSMYWGKLDNDDKKLAKNWYLGTGAITKFNNTQDFFILTCAHNVTSKEEILGRTDPVLIKCEYVDNHGEIQTYELTDMKYDANYLKSAPEGDWEGGTDIGIIRMTKKFKAEPDLPFVLLDTDVCRSKRMTDKEIIISGYPAKIKITTDKEDGSKEEKWVLTRNQYYDTGKIAQEGRYFKVDQRIKFTPWVDDNKEAEKSMVSKYLVHTSGGQSGSPVVMLSATGMNWVVIGVHCVAINNGEMMNGATSLKPRAFDFLRNTLTVNDWKKK